MAGHGQSPHLLFKLAFIKTVGHPPHGGCSPSQTPAHACQTRRQFRTLSSKMALHSIAKGGWPCNAKMLTFQAVGWRVVQP